MDIGVRQGTVWNEMPNPKILGVEGVGRVVADSDGVEGLARGQRVAWVYAPGSYAERSRSRPRRWCRSPTRSTIEPRHP
jgi:NADPH:quinone reductase